MITIPILSCTSRTVVSLLVGDAITLSQYWGFIKGCLLNGFLMMTHVNVGAKTKQNRRLSLYNNPQPLGLTENPLSLDISTHLAVSLKTMAFN